MSPETTAGAERTARKKPRLEGSQSEKLKNLLRYAATPVKIQIEMKSGDQLNPFLPAVTKNGGGYKARWQTRTFKIGGTAKDG